MSALQSITGGKILGSVPNFSEEILHSIDPSLLGKIARVHTETIYGKKYLVFTKVENEEPATFRKHLSTLIVTAFSDEQCSALLIAVEVVGDVHKNLCNDIKSY